MLIYSIRAFGLYKNGPQFVHYLFMALFPMGNIALYGSIYITLAVSIERFLGMNFFRNDSDYETLEFQDIRILILVKLLNNLTARQLEIAPNQNKSSKYEFSLERSELK